MLEIKRSVKAKFLVYMIPQGKEAFECVNMNQPFHTLQQAESIVQHSEPWQRAFIRVFYDLHYTEERKEHAG